MIKDIHLALKVKVFFGYSTPAIAPDTESSSQKPELTTTSHHRYHRERERERNLHIKSYKAKLERLRSVRLTLHEQAVNF
jgi:hypothetical protein